MKYLAWCPSLESFYDGTILDTSLVDEAARQRLDELDAQGLAFLNECDGDTCEIAVAPWDERDPASETDEPEHETRLFRLRIERRVVPE